MKVGSFYCIIIFIIIPFLLLTLAFPNAATSRPIAPTNATTLPQDGEKKLEELRRIGSFAPRCEHKCSGCKPCVAIQVPTTTAHLGGGVGTTVLYTNYEPEGWKCKCGPTLYTP
ncbi:hypothetical protein DM860_017607 [Cuscuta australis]|uniref:Epidermal patterning factor-like protein n=1 Tax=Cuscuta australis TaxID=267555 RepID=A0A328D9B4_9ASTE|nr:hypothetical protein DM860_017607 [Cuscuta australis]